MNDTNYIPEVIEPDTFVRGRLVPVELVRNVRRGWKAGVAYLALLLVAFVASAMAGELTTLALLGPRIATSRKRPDVFDPNRRMRMSGILPAASCPSTSRT